MKILAIETSCDDTGIAVMKASKKAEFSVLANIVSSQTEVHKQYGGVYPFMAKREHQKNSVPVLIEALNRAGLLVKREAKMPLFQQKKLDKILEKEPELKKNLFEFFQNYEKPKINKIAVTYGPGLEPCLWVGVNLARALSYFWALDIIPVNHIEGHILVNVLDKKFDFPAVALVVSGGHTQLVLVKKIGQYKILGETRDDAAGECFDKCAKILGLGYPGGPEIARLAQKNKGRPSIRLPRPMIGTDDYDFSFSGLKTAVLYADRKVENKTETYKTEMSKEIQDAVVEVLIKKTMRAVQDFKAKTIILGGGVSANEELRAAFSIALKNTDTNLAFPSSNLSTDNAVMIAVAGYFNQAKKIGWKKLRADSNLRISK